MDLFVCVRVTKISNLDQSLFQFDKNLTFAILFMNANMDVYGRYGTRAGGGFIAANRPERDTHFLATKDISRESLRKAMEKALQFHEVWKKDNKKVSQILSPTLGSSYLDQPLRKPATPRFPRSNGCIHCHQVAEREVGHYWNRRKPVPDEILWGYSYNELKWKVLGLDQLKEVNNEDGKRLGIQDDESAIRIGRVIQGESRWYRTYCNLEAWNVGLRDGDIILDIDGQGRLDESQFMAYILQEIKPRDNITLTVLRSGTRKKFTYQLNTLQ